MGDTMDAGGLCSAQIPSHVAPCDLRSTHAATGRVTARLFPPNRDGITAPKPPAGRPTATRSTVRDRSGLDTRCLLGPERPVPCRHRPIRGDGFGPARRAAGRNEVFLMPTRGNRYFGSPSDTTIWAAWNIAPIARSAARTDRESRRRRQCEVSTLISRPGSTTWKHMPKSSGHSRK